MAERVVADAEICVEDVQETLLDLVAKSLVIPGRGGDPDLRRLLDTTRAYAGQRLDERKLQSSSAANVLCRAGPRRRRNGKWSSRLSS